MKNKKRILLFNLAVDEDDPVLGFAVTLIARIARQAESVHVITVRRGRYDLPPNVTVSSVGREAGNGRIRSIISFYRLLFTAMREGRFDICFSHMNPLFVVLAAPALAVQRMRIIVWYAHRKRGIIYWLAYFFAWRVLTSSGSSGGKTLVVGQMVDTDLFAPADVVRKDDPPLFISVGRVAPIKDLMTFVRAAGIMRDRGYVFKCLCAGPVLAHDEAYYAALLAEVKRLSLSDIFSFSGPLSRLALPSLYGRAIAHVNACPTGAIDKAVIESMACGTPSIFANTSFISVTGAYSDLLVFQYGDPADLARTLTGVVSAPARMSVAIRAIIVRSYSMDSFMRHFTKLIA